MEIIFAYRFARDGAMLRPFIMYVLVGVLGGCGSLFGIWAFLFRCGRICTASSFGHPSNHTGIKLSSPSRPMVQRSPTHEKNSLNWKIVRSGFQWYYHNVASYSSWFWVCSRRSSNYRIWQNMMLTFGKLVLLIAHLCAFYPSLGTNCYRLLPSPR